MPKIIITALLLVFLPAAFLAAKEQEAITLTVLPGLSQDDGRYSLVVSGESNLPDLSMLDITFTYRFPGGDNERYLDYQRCLVEHNGYQTKIGPFRRRPPAGHYLINVSFDPDRQADEVLNQLRQKYPDLGIQAITGTLIVGDSADQAAQERRQMMALVRAEGEKLNIIYEDIRARYDSYISEQTPGSDRIKEFKDWSGGAGLKLESLVKSILEHDELRVFELVTQAKAAIENSAFLLKTLLARMDELLDLKTKSHLEPGQLREFKDGLDAFFRLTGREVDKNLKELGIFRMDKESIIAALTRIDALLAGLAAGQAMTEANQARLMQEIIGLSQIMPDIFNDELRNLAPELIGLIKSPSVANQDKETARLKLKNLKGKVAAK